MIDTKVTIKLYELDELSSTARAKAIEDHRLFLLGEMSPSDFISGDAEYDTEVELQKTYEAEYSHVAGEDEPVVESIEANEYLFFGNGELAATVRYTGKHPLAGTTVFIFQGVTYEVAHEEA